MQLGGSSRGFAFGRRRKPVVEDVEDSLTPLVSLDFKNGAYSIGGVSKTLGQVVEQDAENWGDFDPARVQAGIGLKDNGSDTANPVVVPAAVLLADGFTAVVTFTAGDVEPSARGQMYVTDFPDYNVNIEAAFQQGPNSAMLDFVNPSETLAGGDLNLGSHCAAYTVEDGNFAGSLDGGTVAVIASDTAGVNAIALSVVGQTILERIDFYAVQPDGDLPTLSAPTFPVNTVAPVVSGTLIVAAMLSCTTGTWTNTPTSYAYQWRRDGVDIGGETASTHTLVLDDVGKMMTCLVTATNADGSTPQISNSVGPILAL